MKLGLLLLLSLGPLVVTSFSPQQSSQWKSQPSQLNRHHNQNMEGDNNDTNNNSNRLDDLSATSTTAARSQLQQPSLVSSNRRDWLSRSFIMMTSASTMAILSSSITTVAWAASTSATTTTGDSSSSSNSNMFAPSFVQEYPDFIRTPQGWSYRDVNNNNNGKKAQIGDRVVFDWSGYTIGYFGRPFQAKGGPQGGAFEQQDLDYERTVLGSGRMIPGLEQALVGMTAGSLRQVLIPYGPLSYPPTKDGDGEHRLVGPTPTTFSGQRALNFVLDNPRIDRTLLFNVKVIRIDSPNAKGGFTRG